MVIEQALIIFFVFFFGVATGVITVMALKGIFSGREEKIAGKLLEESQRQHKEALGEMDEKMRASFGSLSLEALSKSTEEFLKLASSSLAEQRSIGARELESKKALIDEQVKLINTELQKMESVVQELEKDRIEKFAELSQQIQMSSEITNSLAQTTGALKEALSSSQKRGQWGERMAEDIFLAAGMIENINYTKQTTIEGADTRSRPDFTFLLPKGLKVHMDVKFPLDNYLRFLEAQTDEAKKGFRERFAGDVKTKIKQIASREYINTAEGTVDYALCFIPNEQVFSFIYETDAEITTEAIKSRVVICSPLTVIAVLALIRQAMENFALSEATNEILKLLGVFHKQWEKFYEQMEKMGGDIDKLQKTYAELSATRRRALEKPLAKIENIRQQRNIEVPLIADE